MINPTVYTVNNVFEAVELANNLKDKQIYDLFRGQIKNWPLKSSFVLVDEDKRDDAEKIQAGFKLWVKHTKGLEQLEQYPDNVIAVAQHYGLPTNFVDFTTDPSVAGFFSSSNALDEKDMTSCIICLNSAHLLRYWEDKYSDYPSPEILHLQVQNLWRLEAQQGVFLYCPYTNFEDFYPLSKIYFPYTCQVSYPTENQIYPKRKSQLEISLDQYFMKKSIVENIERIKNIYSKFDSFRTSDLPENLLPQRLFNGTLPPELDSWSELSIRPWLVQTNEKLHNIKTNETWEYTIDLKKEPIVLQNEVIDFITKQFVAYKNIRKQLINWSIRIIEAKTGNLIENRFDHYLERLWDGIRVLPYTDEDIIQSLSNCLCILSFKLKQDSDLESDWEKTTSVFYGKTLEVKVSSYDGSYSYAFASYSKLMAAVRDDINTYIDPKWKSKLKGVRSFYKALKHN